MITLTLRIAHRAVALFALVAISAFNAARANHYVLPCGDTCAQPHWVVTGSLNIARSHHTATLLQNGKVLVAGGRGTGVLDSAELYDHATGTWTVTGHMAMPRIGHTATLLSDGRVLVAGGDTSDAPPNFGRTDTAEIYDPATGTWSPTGRMTMMRCWFDATRLQNGKVLIAGGYEFDNLNGAELYDPETGTWSATGSLNVPRYGHTMTLLHDGKVLVARGSGDGDLMSTLSSAELYDATSGTWSVVGDSGRGSVSHTATLLPSGSVLVTGGNPGGIGSDVVLAGSELFDPSTQAWSRAADLLAPRYDHTATVLPTGEVLTTGGSVQVFLPYLQYVTLGSTERFDPNTVAWSSDANLNIPRAGHTATLLFDGTVLAAGGSVVGPSYTETPLASAELYVVASQPLALERWRERTSLLAAGGRDAAIGPIR